MRLQLSGLADNVVPEHRLCVCRACKQRSAPRARPGGRQDDDFAQARQQQNGHGPKF
jgi:predicted metal-binding protein